MLSRRHGLASEGKADEGVHGSFSVARAVGAGFLRDFITQKVWQELREIRCIAKELALGVIAVVAEELS